MSSPSSRKTVRFAADMEEIYTSEGTPSPSFSVSTISLSPGPLTPPPIDPYPTTINKENIICNVLRYKNGTLTFDFDISHDPALLLAGSAVLTPDVLCQPASTPPLGEIHLVSKYLPWRIQILPSSTAPDAYVTVSDILGGLYRALRLRVKTAELNTVPAELKAHIYEAFELRCNRYGTAAEEESRKGIKRIDFMMGRHHFLGLFLADESTPHVWRFSASHTS